MADVSKSPTADILEIWKKANTVCFDVDITVCEDEGIDELAAFYGAGEAVAAWTTSAVRSGARFKVGADPAVSIYAGLFPSKQAPEQSFLGLRSFVCESGGGRLGRFLAAEIGIQFGCRLSWCGEVDMFFSEQDFEEFGEAFEEIEFVENMAPVVAKTTTAEVKKQTVAEGTAESKALSIAAETKQPEVERPAKVGKRTAAAAGDKKKVEGKTPEADRSVKRKASEDACLIPSLPNEIAILCLARVPRSSHHKINGICRSWRDVLHEKVFLDVRQELSLCEEWLFLWTQDSCRRNVWHGFDPSTNKWFALPDLPNDHKTAGSSASAVVDGKLFVIGGQLMSSMSACNIVSYFDMRQYCWKTAAALNIARAKCMAGVINNQLYVVGGFTERDQMAGASAEAYDPVTNTWRLISSMKIPMELYDSAVMGGKFYVVNSSSENLVGLVYDPMKDEWVDMANGLNTGWQSKTAALNGKLYAVGDSHSAEGKNEISVYNSTKDVWEPIKGVLDDTAPLLAWGPELVSLGGKLCIVGTSSRAAVALVEIQESAKSTVANLTHYEDITRKIQFTDPLPRGACQVLAL